MTKWTVLQALKQSDTFLSGETLSQTLGLSRNAVWKAVKALRQDGYDIEASTRLGYRLRGNQDVLSVSEIKQTLKTTTLARSMKLLPTAPHTNKPKSDILDWDVQNGFVLIAGQQRGGKSKRGKHFYSAPKVLYFSLLCFPILSAAELAPFRKAVLQTLATVLFEKYQLTVTVENQNQLFCDGKRLGGVLTEVGIEAESEEVEYLIMGIGLYCNNEVFPSDMDATSLLLSHGKAVDRNHLLATLLNELDPHFQSLG